MSSTVQSTEAAGLDRSMSGLRRPLTNLSVNEQAHLSSSTKTTIKPKSLIRTKSIETSSSSSSSIRTHNSESQVPSPQVRITEDPQEAQDPRLIFRESRVDDCTTAMDDLFSLKRCYAFDEDEQYESPSKRSRTSLEDEEERDDVDKDDRPTTPLLLEDRVSEDADEGFVLIFSSSSLTGEPL